MKDKKRESVFDMSEIYIAQMNKLSQICVRILQAQIKVLRKTQAYNVPGHLTKTRYRGHVHWVRVLNESETKSGQKEKKYLGRKDEKVLHQLASDLFRQSSIRVKERQLTAVKAYIRTIEKAEKRSLQVMNDPDIRQLLQSDYTLPQYLKEWEYADYPHNPSHPEALNISAAGGRMVRSKSESIIISELVKAGIPFRYECQLQIKGMTVYPDFMIRHPITGKLFLWEHLGMMDDSNYAAAASRKIEAYIKSGYIPMINLIITSETKEHPLDFRMVQMMIQCYFQLI